MAVRFSCCVSSSWHASSAPNKREVAQSCNGSERRKENRYSGSGLHVRNIHNALMTFTSETLYITTTGTRSHVDLKKKYAGFLSFVSFLLSEKKHTHTQDLRHHICSYRSFLDGIPQPLDWHLIE